MPGHSLPLLSGCPWTSGIHRMGCGRLGPGPLLFPRALSCPRARPGVHPVPSLRQFCAGAGGHWRSKRGAATLGEASQAAAGQNARGLGQEGPLLEEETAEGLGWGLGTWAAGIQTSTLPPGGGGGRGAASSQTRRDHGPVFPECSGCQAQRAHFPERVIAARACRVAGSLAGAEGVIRALALGLELRARPGISGVDGLCLFLGSEGALERKTKKRLVQFLFWCHTDILKIVGPPRQRKSPETRSIWR